VSRRSSQLPGGRHGLPRSFVVRNQRDRILAAVADTVAEKGYDGMTVEDVVRLSGVSRRTFYDQFADKGEAFFTAYDVATEQTMAATAEAFLSSTYWPEQVRLGLGAFLSFLGNDFALARMGFMEIPLAGPEGEARNLARRAGFEVFLAPGVAMAAHPIPPMVPKLVSGGIFELAYAQVVRGRTDELPSLLPAALYHALAPYLGIDAAVHEAQVAERSIGS
jgi:AcrR family transcriptional regulator